MIGLDIGTGSIKITDDGVPFNSWHLLNDDMESGGRLAFKRLVRDFSHRIVVTAESTDGKNLHEFTYIRKADDILDITPCSVQLSWKDLKRGATIEPIVIHESWDLEKRIQQMDKESILAGFELTNETVKKNGIDDYLRKLLHAGSFETTKNPFTKLVGGCGYDERFFKTAPEGLLKQWTCEFAEFLGRQREKLEKSPNSGSELYQVWESFKGGMN